MFKPTTSAVTKIAPLETSHAAFSCIAKKSLVSLLHYRL